MPDDAPLEVGTTVVIKARKFGVWSLNAARIVYTINDAREVTRFGFANGTLPGHVERGEEQFLIEWNATNGSVWYGLTPFSKPQHPLVKLAARLGRSLQKRFAKESLRRMQNITQKAGP